VRTFIYNSDTIPYTNTDPRRWQDVVFEDWATLSVKTAAQVTPDLFRGDEKVGTYNDLDRNFESAGMGGRLYYAYTIDSVKKEIVCQNKNSHYPGDQFRLSYDLRGDSTIILTGKDSKNKNIYTELDKIDKKFFVIEGRRHPVRL
jgi:hypothetical protein